MWQTLETKARFIAQVMTGESDLRRIEDVDGAALTYAEVKAIASGNPLVIEKASLETELGRWSRLQTEHRETQLKLGQRVRYLTEDLPRLEKRLASLHQDRASRQDTRAEKFVIQLGKDTIRDRGLAGELILRAAQRIWGSYDKREIGTFAGFKLWVADSMGTVPQVLLQGAGQYSVSVSDSALGTMRSVEYALQKLEEKAHAWDQELAETRQRIEDLKAQSDQPFEYAERLRAAIARHQEITEALDLTKNQAGPLESEAQDAPEPDDASMALREMGFPEYRV